MEAIGIPDLDYPARLNAAVELLDRHVESGSGARPCLRTDKEVWTYRKLFEYSNRIANLLVSRGSCRANAFSCVTPTLPCWQPAGLP